MFSGLFRNLLAAALARGLSQLLGGKKEAQALPVVAPLLAPIITSLGAQADQKLTDLAIKSGHPAAVAAATAVTATILADGKISIPGTVPAQGNGS